jgi:hypothetical protein
MCTQWRIIALTPFPLCHQRTHDNLTFDGGIVHALTIILQLRLDLACLIFFSRDAIWQRFYNSFFRCLLASPGTNWSSHIQFFVSHCHCLARWAWLSDWMLQIPRMNVIALHIVLILESMGSDLRETDGDKAIGAAFSMTLLLWSCGNLCFLGCNQKFYIFEWHKLWDWWSEKSIKLCESQ